MDVFYLAVAYLATMRNWQALPAYRVGQFLYFYRLVGVVAFELTQTRALLLVFPNTFEYFFIAYEGDPHPLGAGVLQAALVGRDGRIDLGVHEAPAGVVDPRRAARLHRLPRRALVGRAAAARAVLAGRRFLVRGPAPAADARPRLAVRRRPAARADGHGRRDVGLARRRTAALRSFADGREGRPARPALGDLRADPARRPRVDLRPLRRRRRRRRRQRRDHARRGPARQQLESTLAPVRPPDPAQLRRSCSWATGCCGSTAATSTGPTPSSSCADQPVTTLHDRYTPVLEYRQTHEPTRPRGGGHAPARDADHRPSTGLVVQRLVVETCPKSPSGHSSEYGHLHLLQGGDRSPLRERRLRLAAVRRPATRCSGRRPRGRPPRPVRALALRTPGRADASDRDQAAAQPPTRSARIAMSSLCGESANSTTSRRSRSATACAGSVADPGELGRRRRCRRASARRRGAPARRRSAPPAARHARARAPRRRTRPSR